MTKPKKPSNAPPPPPPPPPPVKNAPTRPDPQLKNTVVGGAGKPEIHSKDPKQR
jgi:hypothetical protein